jgi:hypothetical protein
MKCPFMLAGWYANPNNIPEECKCKEDECAIWIVQKEGGCCALKDIPCAIGDMAEVIKRKN